MTSAGERFEISRASSAAFCVVFTFAVLPPLQCFHLPRCFRFCAASAFAVFLRIRPPPCRHARRILPLKCQQILPAAARSAIYGDSAFGVFFAPLCDCPAPRPGDLFPEPQKSRAMLQQAHFANAP